MTNTANASAPDATLQMIRAEVSVPDFQHWMGARRLQDPDHAMHCLLTECFGDLAPKPFRVITPRGASTAFLYGYGSADADAMREALNAFADPLQSRVIPTRTLHSKPMPTAWQTGRKLGFEVRIRPIVRLERDTSRIAADLQQGRLRPGKECDVFLYEATRHPESGDAGRGREQVYAEWLSRQFLRRGGASLDPNQTRMVHFERTRALRKRNSRYSEGPTAVMRGHLTVTEDAEFEHLLSQGVGRHRAYGYGMLLLRPPKE